MTPGTHEEHLLSEQQKREVGIFACNQSGVYWGYNVPRAHEGSWNSFINTGVFIKVWERLRQDQHYAKHDWTVKVDPDAVFFPDRLRVHLTKLRPPADTALYIENQPGDANISEFGFLGPIEVFSTKAIDVYFLHQQTCKRPYRLKSGEDSYIKSCLDAIGVGHMTDPTLLLNTCTNNASKCDTIVPAAIHAYKEVWAWTSCWETSARSRNDFLIEW